MVFKRPVWNRFKDSAESLTCAAVYMLGFSIPISTALDSALVLLIPLLWILSGRFDAKFALIRNNGAAKLAMAFVGLFCIGMFYGSGTIGDRLDMLGRYSHLLLIVLLVPLLHEERARRRALIGFMTAVTLTLILSYFIAFSVLPAGNLFTGTANDPTVFKLQITQGLFLAYGAFIFAVAARYESKPRLRIAFVLLAALTVYNVLFMEIGRTGYLVLGVLTAYFCFDWLGRKGLFIGAVVLLVLGTSAYFGSQALRSRVDLAAHQLATWHPGKPAGDGNSIGDRLEFYRNSLVIIRKHPIFGVGTGGFAKSYSEQIKGTGMLATPNPHNQFLLITVQLGLIGLAAVLYFFLRLWTLAQKLGNGVDRNLAQGLILLMVAGGLVNSLMMDHAESLLFAWMSGVLYAGLLPLKSERTITAPDSGRANVEAESRRQTGTLSG